MSKPSASGTHETQIVIGHGAKSTGPSYNPMKSLERLTMEHALVGRSLGALEIVARKVDHGDDISGTAVQELLRFLQVFGDRYHLLKEESVLMPYLGEGLRDSAAMEEFDKEHRRARRLLLSMEHASQSLERRDARRTFVRNADRYIALMRGLVAREKDNLIRKAASVLVGRDRGLDRSLRRYVARVAIPETSEQFALDIDAILSQLSVEVPPARVRAYARGTIPYHKSTAVAVQY